MASYPIRSAIAACALLAAFSASLRADGTRPTAIEKYGLGGHIQAIGLHHGFHIETVAPDSAAASDHFRAHDVIIKVDGEVIRSLEHLRALLAEAYMDDGEVTITYTRGTSIEQHVAKCHLRPGVVKPVGRRRRPAPDDEDTR